MSSLSPWVAREEQAYPGRTELTVKGGSEAAGTVSSDPCVESFQGKGSREKNGLGSNESFKQTGAPTSHLCLKTSSMKTFSALVPHRFAVPGFSVGVETPTM